MNRTSIILESVGTNFAEIEDEVRRAYSTILALVGDSESGSKYKISYSNVSNNDAVKRILGMVANEVKSWSESLRGHTQDDAKRRYVYIAASVISPLAEKLLVVAKNMHSKEAMQIFGNLNEFLHEARPSISGSSALKENAFKQAGDNFYKALIASVEVCTESRYQVPVEEDYAAQEELNELYDFIGARFRNVRKIVIEMLTAVGVEESVSAEAVDSAARLLLATSVLINEVFGGEHRDRQWHDSRVPVAKQLYNIVVNSWGKNNATRDMKDSANKDTRYIIDPDTNVVKDMDKLGDNSEQLNIVNNRTKFTCQCYYKIFAIDGLNRFKFSQNGTAGGVVYKIMRWLFSRCGYHVDRLVTPEDAANFANYVRDIFAKAAQSTEVALSLHTTLVEELKNLVDDMPKDKESFDHWLVKTGIGTVDRAVLEKAISNITNFIIFTGDDSIQNGVTADKTQISATALPSAVYTFGNESPNYRNTTDDLVSAGKITSNCFSFHNGVLSVSYNGPLIDESLYVDELDVPTIRAIHRNYVSSSLVPAIVSKSKAWVLLYGIKAFSPIRNGVLDDARMVSQVSHSIMDRITNSGISQNTQLSSEARRANVLSEPSLVDRLGSYGFLSPEEVGSMDNRIELLDKVRANSSADIGPKVTKIRKVCDAYSAAVTAYARAIESSTVIDKIKPIINSVYRVSPTIDEFVYGKQTAVNNTIASYLALRNPDAVEIVKNIKQLTTLCTACNLVASFDLANSKPIDVLRNEFYFVEQFVTTVDSISDASIKEMVLKGSHVDVDMSHMKEAVEAALGASVEDERQIAYFNNFDSFHECVANTYDTVMNAEKRNKMARRYVPVIAAIHAYIMDIRSACMDEWKSFADTAVDKLISSSASNNVLQLRDNLNQVVGLVEKEGVDNTMLDEVKNSMALTMAGDESENLDWIDKMKINKFVIPLKVFGTLLYAAGITEEKISNESVKRDEYFTLANRGDESMGELSAFSPTNLGAAISHYDQLDEDNKVNEVSGADVEIGGGYIKTILSLAETYYVACEQFRKANKIIETAIAMAQQLPNASEPTAKQENQSDDEYANEVVNHWINVFASDPDCNRSQLALFKENAAKRNATKEMRDDAYDQLVKFGNEFKSYDGLIQALIDLELNTREVKQAIKIVSAANSQLKSLTKYKSYDDSGEDGARREFAYTESDDSAISHIIQLIGEFLFVPNSDNVDDLFDSLDTTHDILVKYSGNPLSIKMSKLVQNKLAQSVSDGSGDEGLAIGIVKVINYLGRVIFSRMGDEVDADSLAAINEIRRPAAQRPTSGKAIDSFARSQMRGAPKDVDEVVLGSGDNTEKRARISYIDLVLDDMGDNPELAKFAYTLGKAFNAFDRSMVDERVDNLDTRMFNSTRESLTGKQLWAGRGANDLQRELVSALIDDERDGDKEYPNVTAVVKAAMSGTPFNSYSQMYSEKIGSVENIVNDKKNTVVAFDEKGNRTDPEHAVSLDRNTISQLALGNGDMPGGEPFNSIPSLVHAIRMDIFRKLTGKYGTVDLMGNVSYERNYVGKATRLMGEALNTLYRLCDGDETPIADIIMVSTVFGQKAGRDRIMQMVDQSFTKNEGIDDVVGAIAKIPDGVSADDLRKIANAYLQNTLDELNSSGLDPMLVDAIDSVREIGNVVNKVGLPVGIWGIESSSLNDVIESVVGHACDIKRTENASWSECSDMMLDEAKSAYANAEAGGDVDVDTLGMVANEPNAYPQMLSDESSDIDMEWINGVASLLGSIPESMTKDDVINGIAEYCKNDLSQQRMALNDDTLKLCRIVNNLLRLDTITGIPTGFFGNTSTEHKKRIKDIFNYFVSLKTDDKTWKDCAAILKEYTAKNIERGGNILHVGKAAATKAAHRRIAHLRGNPYYAVDERYNFKSEAAALVHELRDNGIISSGSTNSIVRLKYPGLVFDSRTFSYILKLALSFKEKLPNSSEVESFLIAVMCVVSGVRIKRYLDMLEHAYEHMEASNDDLAKAIEQVKSAYGVHDFGELVKTSLGWFTQSAFNAMCALASDNPVAGFKRVVKSITDEGVKKSFDLKKVTHAPKLDGDKPTEVVDIDDTSEAVSLLDTLEDDDNDEVSSEDVIAEPETPKVVKAQTEKTKAKPVSRKPKESNRQVVRPDDSNVIDLGEHQLTDVKTHTSESGGSKFVEIDFGDDDDDEPVSEVEVPHESSDKMTRSGASRMLSELMDDRRTPKAKKVPSVPKEPRPPRKPKMTKEEILSGDIDL